MASSGANREMLSSRKEPTPVPPTHGSSAFSPAWETAEWPVRAAGTDGDAWVTLSVACFLIWRGLKWGNFLPGPETLLGPSHAPRNQGSGHRLAVFQPATFPEIRNSDSSHRVAMSRPLESKSA